MESREARAEVAMEAGKVRFDFDPRRELFVMRADFQGVLVQVTMSEEEADALRLAPAEVEVQLYDKLYREARGRLLGHYREQDDAKLGLGYAGPVLR